MVVNDESLLIRGDSYEVIFSMVAGILAYKLIKHVHCGDFITSSETLHKDSTRTYVRLSPIPLYLVKQININTFIGGGGSLPLPHGI